MQQAIATSDIEGSISEVLNGSGLPPAPDPTNPREYTGELVPEQDAVAVTAAIERAFEDTLKRMYESVEQNEAMVRGHRKKVDEFAEVMRSYCKTHVQSLSEFMLHLHRTSSELDKHIEGFEERLKTHAYPRANGD